MGQPAQLPVTTKQSRLIFWASRRPRKKKARRQRRRAANVKSKRLFQQSSKQKRKLQAQYFPSKKFSPSRLQTRMWYYPKFGFFLLTQSKAFASKRRRGNNQKLFCLSNKTRLRLFMKHHHLVTKKISLTKRIQKLKNTLTTLRMKKKLRLPKHRFQKKRRKIKLRLFSQRKEKEILRRSRMRQRL